MKKNYITLINIYDKERNKIMLRMQTNESPSFEDVRAYAIQESKKLFGYFNSFSNLGTTYTTRTRIEYN